MYKGKKLKTSLIGLTTVGIAVGLNHYSEQHAKADTNDSAVGTYQNQNQLQELPVSADDLIDQTVTTNQTDKVVTTTTVGTLNPSTNLIHDENVPSSLAKAVLLATNQGIQVSKTDTKSYGNVGQAANDYVNQISHIKKVMDDYQQSLNKYTETRKEYEQQVYEWQIAKDQYERDLRAYQAEQDQYDDYQKLIKLDKQEYENNQELSNVSQLTEVNGDVLTTTTTALVNPTDNLKLAIDQAKTVGITVVDDSEPSLVSIEQAQEANEELAMQINATIKKYQSALDKYEAAMAVYDEIKSKYDETKHAYDEYLQQVKNNDGIGGAVTQQGLVFELQNQATMTISGADKFLSLAAIDKVNYQDVLSRFDKSVLDANPAEFYQTTNPNQSDENTWLILKKGQPVEVVYNNLSGVSYNGLEVAHVRYTYTLNSSSDGSDEAMAQIMHDPTETIWVGSNTLNPEQHLNVSMKIEFLDADGNKIDTSDGRAILSMASLNHYTTVPYITDDGEQESVQMNHLERVNIGNNEFVPIPGSSVSLNSDNWIYSIDSNQRVSEGAKFNADDTYVYVNKQMGQTFTTTDSEIVNNQYIMAHGGADNWVLGTHEIGWDSLPNATINGEWPINKYYGAGAIKLLNDTIQFDVSGNNSDFNTSYWFVVNSAVAIPKNPGDTPVRPIHPSPVSLKVKKFKVVKERLGKLPTNPEPKFDHELVEDKSEEPTSPKVEWHLAKIIEINQIPTPGEPEEPTLGEPEEPTPSEPVKSILVAKHPWLDMLNDDKQRQLSLPQTGNETPNHLIGLGLLTVSLMMFGFKRKKQN